MLGEQPQTPPEGRAHRYRQTHHPAAANPHRVSCNRLGSGRSPATCSGGTGPNRARLIATSTPVRQCVTDLQSHHSSVAAVGGTTCGARSADRKHASAKHTRPGRVDHRSIHPDLPRHSCQSTHRMHDDRVGLNVRRDPVRPVEIAERSLPVDTDPRYPAPFAQLTHHRIHRHPGHRARQSN